MDLKGKKINFLGDSITQGVGASDADHVYHQVLKKSAGLAEARNYGLSGTRIARQQHPTEYEPSFDRDFCMRAAEMDPDADAVVVFGGTNDFGHGDAPLGRPHARHVLRRTAHAFCLADRKIPRCAGGGAHPDAPLERG